MKITSMLMTAALVCCIAPAFAGEGWLTNLDDAKKVAAAEKKGILIEFTGSDWCPPCKQLKKAVLDNSEFLELAKKEFVLLELDFPRSTPQDPTVRTANAALMQKYGVSGFPTVLFTDADGVPFGGFVGGRDLNSVKGEMAKALEGKAEIADLLRKLQEATGEDRITLLAVIYKAAKSDAMVALRNDISTQLLELDLQDKSGLIKEIKAKIALENVGTEISSVMKEIAAKHPMPVDIDALLQDWLLCFERTDVSVLAKQVIASRMMNLYLIKGEVDSAIALLNKAVTWDPESPQAPKIKEIVDGIIKNREKIIKDARERTARESKK